MTKEYSKYMALAPNTIKREVFRIQYETTDESFDHAFGRETKTSLEWTKAEAFVPVLDEWIDVTNNSEFQNLANQLLIEAMENNEHGDRDKDRADDLWFVEYKERKAGLSD